MAKSKTGKQPTPGTRRAGAAAKAAALTLKEALMAKGKADKQPALDTSSKRTEGATKAAELTLKEVLAREFTLPRDHAVARAALDLTTSDGERKHIGDLVLVPRERADNMVCGGWVQLIDDPLLDCTQRELYALDGGHVSVFE